MKILLVICAALVLSSISRAQCPTVTVVGPPGVTEPGDKMTFRAEGVIEPGLDYRWSVSVGWILRGQGTPENEVSTDTSMAGLSVIAAVSVLGLSAACKNDASESAPVATIAVCNCTTDEWGKVKPNEVRARLDSFFAELSNNPTSVGVMFIYVGKNDRLNARHKRIRFVVKHARYREFDVKRIWFVLEPNGDQRTKLYRIPPHTDPVRCDGPCVTIKGGDIK